MVRSVTTLLVFALISGCGGGANDKTSLNDVSRFAKRASLIIQLDFLASQEMQHKMLAARSSGDPSEAISTARQAAVGFREASNLDVPGGFENTGDAAKAYAATAGASYDAMADALETRNSSDIEHAINLIHGDTKYASRMFIAFKSDLRTSGFAKADQSRLLERLKGG